MGSAGEIPRGTGQTTGDFILPFGEADYSTLAQMAAERLAALPLEHIKQAGIWRNRASYFLNIAYPSMQAMDTVAPAQLTERDTKDGKKVALYVHVPFCTAECYYCHYYKQFKKDQSHTDSYLDGVEQELQAQAERFGGLEAASIYIGGGTPSYLSAEQIDRLFNGIRRYVNVPEGIETSFEVHPESATPDRLAVLAAHGVNRVNIGVESFNDATLKGENRRHTAQEAIEAFERVNGAGITNVNLDLIYGLKGQTLQMWEESLDRIAALQPASATMYYLRLKRGTPEYKLWKMHPENFPTDDELLLMHAMNFERMEGELGYLQKPVDWFIKSPDLFHTYQDHNWRRSDDTELLGIGPSAYSYVNGWQSYNVNNTEAWLSNVQQGTLPVWRGEQLEGDERMRRTIMLGIKMGIDRAAFANTYGADALEAFYPEWAKLHGLGLVEVTDQSIDLSYAGKLFADEVGQQFYSGTMKSRMQAIDPELVSTTWPQFNP